VKISFARAFGWAGVSKIRRKVWRKGEMILYHFTALHNLDHPEDGRTILKEGLKPNGKKGMPPLDAVWFTTQADPELMFAKEDGTLDAGWKKHNARIKVVIPSSDKRLVKWETWLREQSFVLFNGRVFLPSEMINAIYAHNLMGYKFYYVYFGSIPPSEFRVVEYADPQMRAETETELLGHG
jgi:hypothetical protein